MQDLRDREPRAQRIEDVEAARRPVQVAGDDEIVVPAQDRGLGPRKAVGPFGCRRRGFVGEPERTDAMAREREGLRQPALPDAGAALGAGSGERDDRQAGRRGFRLGRALQQDRPADPPARLRRGVGGQPAPELRGAPIRGEPAGPQDGVAREQHLAAGEGQARIVPGQGGHVEAGDVAVVEHAQARDGGGSGERRFEAEGHEGAGRQHVAGAQEQEVVGCRVIQRRREGVLAPRARRCEVVAGFAVALGQDRRDGVREVWRFALDPGDHPHPGPGAAVRQGGGPRQARRIRPAGPPRHAVRRPGGGAGRVVGGRIVGRAHRGRGGTGAGGRDRQYLAQER
ncbi:hypothetical protein AEGHOMDF_2368 [Methylobacterium soli]|nr:hypothetical protein AEGHOMDF_2368 [Methylobacterium soli]